MKLFWTEPAIQDESGISLILLRQTIRSVILFGLAITSFLIITDSPSGLTSLFEFNAA